jgi:hypothetical protein
MGGFNSSLGAAADAMHGATSGASGMAGSAGNIAAALQHASQQQQQLRQQTAQQAKEEEADYWKEIGSGKAQPFEPYAESKGSDGLVKRSANPPPGPGAVRTLPISGKQLYYPTEGEKSASKDKQQAFTDLKSALDDGARPAVPQTASRAPWASPDSTTGAGDDPSRVVTPPGSKQAYYIPTGDEKAAMKTADAVKQKQALNALGEMPIPDDVNEQLGLKPGGNASFADLIRAHHELNAPDASQSIIPGYTGAGGGPITRDPKTGKTAELQMPAGAKAALTPAQQAVQERATQRNQDRQDKLDAAAESKKQAGVDAGQKQIDVYQKQEQEQHALRSAYSMAATTKDGDSVIDPKTRNPVVMNPARRTFYKQQYDAATSQVQRLQDTQQKILQRHGGAAPAAPGKPATATPSAPKYTEAQVRQRAAGAGKDANAAVAAARAARLIE